MKHHTLSKLFSKKSISSILNGDTRDLNDIFVEFPKLINSTNLSSLYESAYRILLNTYQNEYLVKNEITNKFFLRNNHFKKSALISELQVGENIADFVIIDEKSTCFEIKTEFDSLTRLNDQLKTYLKVFEKTYIVCHKKHISKLLSIFKETPYFGIIELTENRQFETIQEAPSNNPTDNSLMFSTLRKPEYTYIAEQILGHPIPTMGNAFVYSYCKDLFENIDINQANVLYKESLSKFRKNDCNFIKTLPKSMKNVGVSIKFSKSEKKSLLDALHSMPINIGDITDVLPLPERKTA